MAKHIHSVKVTQSEMEMMLNILIEHLNSIELSDDGHDLLEQLKLLYGYRNFQIMGWMNDDKPF